MAAGRARFALGERLLRSLGGGATAPAAVWDAAVTVPGGREPMLFASGGGAGSGVLACLLVGAFEIELGEEAIEPAHSLS